MAESSNTGDNRKPGTFRPNDPRINRKGRPKVFDELRALSLAIAHEKALTKGEPVVINGHIATVVEVVLRQWWQSKNPLLQRGAMEIAFGKVPDKLDVTSGGEKIDSISDAAIVEAIRILGGSNGCQGCGGA